MSEAERCHQCKEVLTDTRWRLPRKGGELVFCGNACLEAWRTSQ